jgi:UDP-N-acetylmuramyl pentapeptide phosphotransferase/UDP-N-acetylglucosamine-1-phosphate transferase
MHALLATLVVLAEKTGPRHDSPGTGTGIGIIILIVVLVALVFAAIFYGMSRAAKRRREKGEPEGTHPSGRVGQL